MARKIVGDKVAETESTGFDPIPAGKYLAYIFEVTAGEYSPTSKNPGRENYNIQYKIAEGQSFENRRIFDTVGLFPVWSSGSDNFRFFQFFAAAEGVTGVELRKRFNAAGGELEIPDPQDLEGRLVELTIGIQSDTYEGKERTRNNVRGVVATKGDRNSVTASVGESGVRELDITEL